MSARKKTPINLILGALLLTVLPQIALSQPAIGVGLVQNGGANLSNGMMYNGVITLTSGQNPSDLSETMVGPVSLIPACTIIPMAGTPCPSPDAGVITVQSAVSTSGAACPVTTTWTVGGGPGIFTLTPSAPVTFATVGTQCIITYTAIVNSLPTVDAEPSTAGTIETGASAQVTVEQDSDTSNTAGGVGTTHNTVAFMCGVQIDKQISCDGGMNWSDVGYGDAATNGCIGTPDADILYRYKINNNGNVGLTSCSIDDDVLSSITTGQSLAAGMESNFFTANGGTPEACSEHPGNNTGTVSCTCDVPLEVQPTAMDSDTAGHQCCGVQVDKQVSCNGGMSFVDEGLTSDNGEGTNGCQAPVGTPLQFQYFAQNTGSVALSCSFNDTQDGAGGVSIVSIPSGIDLAVGGGTVQLGDVITNQTCSTEFGDHEPNTGTLSCACDAGDFGSTTLNVHDSASVECLSPGLNVSKVCEEQDPQTGLNHVVITSTNVGDVALDSCTVTDTYYPGSGACPTDGTPMGTPTDLSVVPSNFSLPTNGSEVMSLGDIAGLPSGSSCNTVSVICNMGTATEVSDTARATCDVPGQGCFSRTPGYWGTHPSTTSLVLNGGLDVCGLTLTEVADMVANSATEDLCVSGRDFKQNDTSPQQTSLIRACTAAALNLKASADAGLSCDAEFPNIATQFEACCLADGGGLCSSGASPQQISASGCIGFLDTFNNAFEDTSFEDANLTNQPADPGFCQAANGNGFMNPGRNLGPAK